MGDTGGCDGRARRGRLRRWRPREAWVAPASSDDHLLRSGGLSGVLQRRPPLILYLFENKATQC
ncbi:uncharacterized protein [Zea mays]|uniref:uncharacterized protein n=1 Tax=Zea mays TaxID=4577 RepID=UPI0016520975|nr:uncharacterized protein LOC118476242 [Zea mays]